MGTRSDVGFILESIGAQTGSDHAMPPDEGLSERFLNNRSLHESPNARNIRAISQPLRCCPSEGVQRRLHMRLVVLALLLLQPYRALPASAEVIIRAGDGGVAVHAGDGVRHHDGWRHDRAECRVDREKITTPSGRVSVKSHRNC
jgi:hypothetical protein